MKEIKNRISDKTDNTVRQETIQASTTAEVTEQPSFGIGNITPSISAGHILKYAHYPVLPSLGLTNIEIPLYTIQAGSLKMPITLTYHASGIKVDEISESVGLGWTLNAGGAVTKEIRGAIDEEVSNHSIPEAETVSLDELSMIIAKYGDDCWDKYYYTYPGGSGSFLVKILQQDDIRIIKTCNNDDKIEIDVTVYELTFEPYGLFKKINYFTVTDALGNKYEYRQKDDIRTILINRKETSEGIEDAILKNQDSETTAWLLTDITSPDGKDCINLAYEDKGLVAYTPEIDQSRYYYKYASDTEDTKFELLKNDTETNSNFLFKIFLATYYKCISLTEITYNGNRITFSYDKAPEPIIDMMGGLPDIFEEIDINPARRLAEMTVYNICNEQIRKIKFDNRDNEHDIKRFKLNGIEFFGMDGKPYDKYAFEYNEIIGIGIQSGVAPEHVEDQDFFGYYNGPHTSADVCFLTPYGIDSNCSNKRDYSFEHAKWKSLISIKRLNGNETKIIYEPNTHHDSIIEKDISIGLRVKEIQTFDDGQHVLSRKFEYADSGCTIDFWRLDIADFTIRKQTGTSSDDTKSYLQIHAAPVLPGVSPRNAMIFYGHVTETTIDLVNNRSLRTEYEYDTQTWKYDYVNKEYTLPTTLPADKWKFINFQTTTNTNPQIPSQGTEHYVGEIKGYFRDRPQFFGNVKKIIIKESCPDGSYKTVSETEYTYQQYVEQQLSMKVGIYVKNMTTTEQLDSPKWFSYPSEPNHMRTKDDCYYFDITENVFLYRPIHIRQTDYYGNDTHIVSSEIGYSSPRPYKEWPNGDVNGTTGSTQSLVQRQERFTKDGDSYTRRLLYPTDYVLTPTVEAFSIEKGFKWLREHNITDLLIGEELIKNDTDLQATYTNFKPVTLGINGMTSSKPYQTKHYLNDTVIHESTVEEYDCYGNPAYVRETGKPDMCYVWSYRGMYPVAEIQGASYDEVENALGGSDALDTIAQATSHTSFIDTLDELRDALPDAMVTTYTYMPLVGITSVTDAAGRMKTFHYDGAGRLNAIKDDEGNILETYEYGHKNEE